MALEKLKISMEVLIRPKKTAMGYNHRSSIAKIIKRIEIKYPDKLKIYYNRSPRQYEAL